MSSLQKVYDALYDDEVSVDDFIAMASLLSVEERREVKEMIKRRGEAEVEEECTAWDTP
jgi:uncharacterized protein YeeX (DUF496 family)